MDTLTRKVSSVSPACADKDKTIVTFLKSLYFHISEDTTPQAPQSITMFSMVACPNKPPQCRAKGKAQAT
jgi:hypothetical protein